MEEHSKLDLDKDRKLIDDKLAITEERYILFLFINLERDLLGSNTLSNPLLVKRILKESVSGLIDTKVLEAIRSEGHYSTESFLSTLRELFRY